MRPEEFTICLLDEIDYYVSKARPYLRSAKVAAAADSAILDIWYSPADDKIFIRRTCKTPYTIKEGNFGTEYLFIDTASPDPFWCGLSISAQKTASQPTLWQTVQGAAGWNDMFYPPSPLAAMLATGVLGAGLGYGGAAIASNFLPRDWDKKKFRRSGLLLGGAVGAAPGALESLDSLLLGQSLLDGSHMRLKNTKRASLPGHSSVDSMSMLQTIWQDPYVSRQLTGKEKSLMTGALSGTQMIAGSSYLTPSDMARLTAGMGAGYASGLVAGKVLGALTGMPQRTQQTLAQTGMYAGAVKSVLPMLYGMR